MYDFIKKNIYLIFLFIITLSIGFLTFLTFIDKGFIELSDQNLQLLLIINIVLLTLLFIFIFFEINKAIKNIIQDEATLFINNNLKIKFIDGETLNNKITFKEDVNNTKTYFGIGFDVHRLIQGKKLYLGGIKIPFHSGLKGHSDGDAILHSIIDALLGAMRKKDIGTFFPDNKNRFKNIRSPKMLAPIVDILNKNNFYINNLDINLICEQPKVSKYRVAIINSLSNLLKLDKNLINLKGKTVEKLGLIGKEKAIACEVICSISQ